MSSVFFTSEDALSHFNAQLNGTTGQAERLAQSLALRRQHEQATEQLRRRLPFVWYPGITVPKYKGEQFFTDRLPAVHIMIGATGATLPDGEPRWPGEWLCSRSVNLDTGELKYESKPADMWADGSGGLGSHYHQQPTCKKCLAKAEKFWPAPAATSAPARL